MESPPSTSTWSESYILSEDSGLLLTSGSFSSGSISGESRSCGRFAMELQDSDCEDKSLSQADSLDGMSDIMCGENFNTLKKGPHWIDLSECKHTTPIDPPPEFQDKPNILLYEALANKLVPKIINEGIHIYCKTYVKCMKLTINTNATVQSSGHQVLTSYWTSEFLPFGSPPSTRRSLVSSRLSSSHNSLSVPSARKVDDSSFITQAVSHDMLVSCQISDIYNVPFDSDIYAVPVDVVRQPLKHKRNQQHKKRRRNTSSCCHELDDRIKQARQSSVRKYYINYVKCNQLLENRDAITKRHSVAGSSAHVDGEPVHMTLQEVRHYLQTLYSSSSDSSVHKDKDLKNRDAIIVANNNNNNNSNNNNNNKYSTDNKILLSSNTKNTRYNSTHAASKFKKNTFLINIKNKRVKDPCDGINKEQISLSKSNKPKKSTAKMSSLKQTLCNIFRFRRFMSPDRKKTTEDEGYGENIVVVDKEARKPIINRALPPLPLKNEEEEQGLDFTTSIQKVKDYGWYWGPISSEAAEKILSNEPDGSFIVRDSSDDHYIFSLTFKLNNSVRHVRIEHDQGNFSFGSCTKFKSQTIVEFIENAVEHSRSGRYLFFLHRRPVIGPVRVQLLHPVSRFKQIQSLQHMCRFVILKLVRRDLLSALPLPRRMIDYLNTPHYYSEHLSDVEEQEENGSSNNNNNNNSMSLYNGAQNNTQDEVMTVNNNVITSVPTNNELTSPVFISNVRQS